MLGGSISWSPHPQTFVLFTLPHRTCQAPSNPNWAVDAQVLHVGSMQVLVLGPPRTGTQCVFSSLHSLGIPNIADQWAHQALAEALTQLGISHVYHMREVGKNQHQGLWVRALEDNLEGKGPAWVRDDFEKILAGFQVRVPGPVVHSRKEALPVLLCTVRYYCTLLDRC